MTQSQHYKKLTSMRSSHRKKLLQSLLASDKHKVTKSFSKYRNNLYWLADHRDEIRKDYGDRYVAIHDNDVCIDEKDLRKLLEIIKDRYSERKDEIVIDFVGKKSVNLLL